ncbi:eceriferum 26-like protein, partial [Tanacetum coccineum]
MGLSKEESPIYDVKISTVGPGYVSGQGVVQELNGMDLAMKLHYIRNVYYFRRPALEGLTIINIKETMFYWLNHAYIPCGRFRKSDSGRPSIKCNDCGVRLIEAKCKMSLDEWLQSKDDEGHKLLVPNQFLGPDLPYSPLVLMQFFSIEIMSNKNKQNNRSNKRNVKLPNRYNDHVMSNVSKKRSNSEHKKKNDEIRVNFGGNSEDSNDLMNNKLGEEAIKTGDLNARYEDISVANKRDDYDFVDLSSEEYVLMNDKDYLDDVSQVDKLNDKECLDDVTQVDKLNEISSENIEETRLNENEADRFKTSPIKFYAAYVAMNSETSLNNQLRSIPTVLNDSGEEVVVFDEEMVKIGSKKWELTLCGQCVGHFMSLPMLNYHLRRMWARYGYKEITDNGNGNWLFKFTRENGLNEVAAKSPWMVNGKPLVVYKWDLSIGLDKVEPK